MSNDIKDTTVNVLVRNAVKCLSCNTVLESKHRHDYQACYCSNRVYVDGTDFVVDEDLVSKSQHHFEESL